MAAGQPSRWYADGHTPRHPGSTACSVWGSRAGLAKWRPAGQTGSALSWPTCRDGSTAPPRSLTLFGLCRGEGARRPPGSAPLHLCLHALVHQAQPSLQRCCLPCADGSLGSGSLGWRPGAARGRERGLASERTSLERRV